VTTKIANRRRIRRYSVAQAKSASIEFGYPNPNGRQSVLPLIDISVAGFSFELNEPFPGLELGSSIEAVVVKIGDCEIKGDLVVMHLTDNADPEAVCGALFYPESETELVKLKCVVAGIEAQQGS
jgi:hypothetical protein